MSKQIEREKGRKTSPGKMNSMLTEVKFSQKQALVFNIGLKVCSNKAEPDC